MTTKGIDIILVETHNWGKTVAFWKGLGYVLDFETDHHSGQLRHPAGGPKLFVAERAADQPLRVVPGLSVERAAGWEPPTSGKVKQPFVEEHWGVLQLILEDPDGREVAIEAPLPEPT